MKDLKIGETYTFDAGGYLNEGKLIRLVPYGGNMIGHYGQFLIQVCESHEANSSLIAEEHIFTNDQEAIAHCKVQVAKWNREIRFLTGRAPTLKHEEVPA